MFYTYNIDITNDKQMFNFLKDHYKYYTGNSWNRTRSIANNVKLYNLDLEGDWTVALSHLESGDYDIIDFMIKDWEADHPGYSVGFNGRSGGYLVLYNRAGSRSILPETLDYTYYEDYKTDMRDYYGSVKANRDELRFYVKLVRDFDKLCDELRDFVNELSKQKYEIEEMHKIVEEFNDTYADDLGYLGFSELEVDEKGGVDISEIYQLQCFAEAFQKIADRRDVGYRLALTGAKVKLERI